jgi:hypothetical protein
MKISDSKFKKILAIAGISTSMILTGGCAADDDTITVNGKKYKKVEKDGEEGYIDGGVFIPFNSSSSSSSAKYKSSSSIKSGKSGLGSSISSGRGASS